MVKTSGVAGIFRSLRRGRGFAVDGTVASARGRLGMGRSLAGAGRVPMADVGADLEYGERSPASLSASDPVSGVVRRRSASGVGAAWLRGRMSSLPWRLAGESAAVVVGVGVACFAVGHVLSDRGSPVAGVPVPVAVVSGPPAPAALSTAARVPVGGQQLASAPQPEPVANRDVAVSGRPAAPGVAPVSVPGAASVPVPAGSSTRTVMDVLQGGRPANQDLGLIGLN